MTNHNIQTYNDILKTNSPNDGNKMEKTHIVRTVEKSKREIVETAVRSAPQTHIYITAHYWLGTRTSITSGGVKQLLLAQAITLSEIVCHAFSHMREHRDTFLYKYTSDLDI